MSRDSHTPAQRADAVLRAAEAAAAAAQAAAAAAHAASLPPDPAPVAAPAPEASPTPAAAPYPQLPREPPIHEAGAAGRLLAAAGELEAHIAQAREQLDALEEALGRLERHDAPAE